MKIGINEIEKMIADCKDAGYELRMKDIMYVQSLQFFKDKRVSFATLFGRSNNENEIEEYDNSKKIRFLKKYIKNNYIKDEEINEDSLDDISFDENKAYMLNLKKKTEEGIKNGTIKQDKGIEILTKLSIALNDKFAVSEKQDEKRVVVLKKYNHICEYTHKECFLQTKEYAMEHWGLIEKEHKNEEDNE